jgi:hypothetical protein
MVVLNILKYMRKNIFFLLLFSFVTSFSFGQVINKSNYSNEFVNACIKEVFQEQSDKLVFNGKSKRLDIINNFMSRVKIVYSKKNAKEKYKELSTLRLNNKLNKDLKYDKRYNEKSFNPLKYKFNMYSQLTQIVRIDDRHIIVISPVNY